MAGVCQTHHDPGGYIMTRPKAKPSSEDAAIGANGDIFMTIMGWLNNVPAGGGTAFDHPQKGCSNVLKGNIWKKQGRKSVAKKNEFLKSWTLYWAHCTKVIKSKKGRTLLKLKNP